MFKESPSWAAVAPSDQRDNVLGGSTVFFSFAVSYFAPVRLVGVVGEDWPAEHTEEVVDPTGAGDSFAGGMMGYLAEQDSFEPDV